MDLVLAASLSKEVGAGDGVRATVLLRSPKARHIPCWPKPTAKNNARERAHASGFMPGRSVEHGPFKQ